MTNPEFVKRLHQAFKGRLSKRQGRGKNWKPQYDWEIGNNQAAKVLEILLPYFKLKRKQAKLGIRLAHIRSRNRLARKWGPGRAMPNYILNEYEILYKKMLQLNKRGKNV